MTRLHSWTQVVETLKGGMDTAVLERMVKIMSYMRGASGKPGKLKKKDKLRMLEVSCDASLSITVCGTGISCTNALV